MYSIWNIHMLHKRVIVNSVYSPHNEPFNDCNCLKHCLKSWTHLITRYYLRSFIYETQQYLLCVSSNNVHRLFIIPFLFPVHINLENIKGNKQSFSDSVNWLIFLSSNSKGEFFYHHLLRTVLFILICKTLRGYCYLLYVYLLIYCFCRIKKI